MENRFLGTKVDVVGPVRRPLQQSGLEMMNTETNLVMELVRF